MNLVPEHAVMAAMGACLAGALASRLLARFRALAAWVSVLGTAAGAVLAAAAAFEVLGTGPGPPVAFLDLPRFGFALRLHVDGLTAVFLLLTAAVSVPVSVFSVAYLDHPPAGNPAAYHPSFLLFLAAMYGLVSTTDLMWFFFIFWQLMTLPGYRLIGFQTTEPAARKAARKYLLMMQVACAVTLVGAEILASAGAAAPGGTAALKYDFSTISARLPALLRDSPALTATAFALFLAGFGIKLGMWPFGRVWLPDAHPAAPSPISAMLSGVMIKTGIYGLVRMFLGLVPEAGREHFPVGAWGWVMAILGTITLLDGTARALGEHQSKRLLAYSSIGQAGYLLLGLGTSMVLLQAGSAAASALAALTLSATLVHVFSHGLAKALLFLDAGAVLQATGTQDLNHLGGLASRMPATAASAAVACLALSGLPLFSGYASKWGLYVGTLGGAAVSGFLPVTGAVALLASAITLAVALKFFGLTFLTLPSPTVLRHARAGGAAGLGPSRSQKLALGTLAGILLLLGLAPGVPYHIASRALAASRHGYGGILAENLPPAGFGSLGIAFSPSGALFEPAPLLAPLAVLSVLVLAGSLAGRAPRRAVPPWLCGCPGSESAPSHPAQGFGTGFFRGGTSWHCRPRPPLATAPAPPEGGPG